MECLPDFNTVLHSVNANSNFYLSADIVKSMDFQSKKIVVLIACPGIFWDLFADYTNGIDYREKHFSAIYSLSSKRL